MNMDSKSCACNCGSKCGKCISWSAIFVGALVGLGLSFLLNLFSIAIGLVAYKTTQEGVMSFAVGGYIGLMIGAIVSYFFAGWTAGHLGFPHCAKDRGMFYGFTTWVVSGVLAMLLAGHMGHYASYRTNLLTDPNATYVTVDAVPASSSNSSATIASDNKEAANAMMTVAWASFFLFLVAAISSMLGAHCAFKCRYREQG